MSVIVTKTLLKVVISILGNDASAKWIERNNFLNLTEDEQIELVANISSSQEDMEDGFVYEENEEIKEFDLSDSSYEEMTNKIDDFFKTEGNYIEEIREKTVKTTVISVTKRFTPAPRSKGEFFLQRKIFGKRGRR